MGGWTDKLLARQMVKGWADGQTDIARQIGGWVGGRTDRQIAS